MSDMNNFPAKADSHGEEMAPEDVLPTPVPPPAFTAPVLGAPLERKMERTDLLEVENIYLKVENVRLQIERQQQEIARSGQALNGLKAELRAKQIALSEKYGVDILQTHIGLDGTITPLSPANGKA